MEIKIRPLNTGESFLCSIKKAKEVFRDTSVTLSFAYTSRIYGTFSRTPDAFYLKNKIKGTVVASMAMHPTEKTPLLCFYVLKKKDISSQIQHEFETKFLLEFYHFYQTIANDQTLNNSSEKILVELLNGRLNMHKLKL